MTQSQRTVLIVDDIPQDREMYRRYLANDPDVAYTILEAESAEAGLALCQLQQLDGILLDFLLPDLNGLQFLAKLRMIVGETYPPIVMISGQGNESIAVQAIKNGAEDYLVKCRITPDGLRSTLSSAIENAELRLALKNTEQALRESEQRYRAIVQSQTELICRFLPDGTLTFVNEAYSRYFNRTPEALLGQNFLQLIPEAERSIVDAQIEALNALTPGSPVLMQEHQVLRPDGEIGWQQWTNRAIFNADHQIVEFQAVGRDISDRKATENSLQLANERFELAATAVNCLIYDWDLSCHVVTRSRGLTELLGYEPETVEASPQWWWQQMHPEDLARFGLDLQQAHLFFDTLQEKLVGVDRYYCEYQVRHRDGRYIWVEDRGLVVRDSAGQAIRIVGSTSDISNRKQAEAALRESEARLKRLIDLNLLGVEFWDADGTVLDANDAFLNIIGYTREDLEAGRVNWRALTPPEQLGNSDASIAKMRQRTSDTLEKEYIRKDGSRVSVLLGGVMFEGSHDRGISFVVDLTEQKRTERELRHNQERLQRLIDTAQIGIAFARQSGEILEANDALLKILGYTREEFLAQGMNWRKISAVESQDLDRCKMEELQQLGQVSATEKEMIRKDGTRVPILASATQLESEDDEHVAFIVDLTEAKRAEAALQQSESLFRGVFESDLIGILFWNSQGQITDANEAFCCLTGYSREELQTGQINYCNITPPEYHELDAQKFAAMQRTGEFLPIEKEYICKDGSRIPILLGCAFLPGSTDRGVAFVLNIQEQKRLEQERQLLLADAQTARASAELANRTKDEFLAIVSHELRSPLNVILGWTKLLRSRHFDPAKVEQALETIDRNAQIQAKLIEDLLDMSRILRGQLSLDMAPAHLAQIIDVVVTNGQLAAIAKQIQLRASIDPEVGRVLGDANRLQQIITNLVTNAIKFTPNGGQIEVSLEQVGTQAAVRVKDTGQGISADFLPYVFERFRQAENSTTRAKEGLGLGLAIVRHLVELHGGTVHVESPGIGQGATFTVQFPLIDEVEQLEIVESTAAIADLTQVKILIVDDVVDTCDYLQFVLSDLGATVAVAQSAAQAYQLFQEFAPDILLSDIGMPEEDGYSLLQRIRELPGGKEVIAIALTAFAKSEDRDRALQAGFQDHLAKPVDPDDLVSAIAKFLRPGK